MISEQRVADGVRLRPRKPGLFASGAFRSELALAWLFAFGAAMCFLTGARFLGWMLALWAVVLIAFVVLVAFGSHVTVTPRGMALSNVFLPYFLPWSHVRGFVVDRGHDVYVLAWHDLSGSVRRYEVPFLGRGNAALVEALLSQLSQQYLVASASDRQH